MARAGRLIQALLGLPLLFVARAASADAAAPDLVPSATDPQKYQIDRTWLYGDDARVPAPWTVVATSSLSYTNIGNDPTRLTNAGPAVGSTCIGAGNAMVPCYSAFAGNVAQPGGMMTLGAEMGIVPRLSVTGAAMMGVGGGAGVPSPSVGGLVGLRFQILPSSWTHTHLVVSGGYLREAWDGPIYNDDNGTWLPGAPHGDNGGWLQVAFSGDIQRLRLAGSVHGEHIFSTGRDPLDVMVNLGASYRIVGDFRLGAEYVGQDLEESFSPGAEGGARHFLGPTASVQLWQRRVTIIGGPSIGLSALSPDYVARIAASVGF
jgi:hypothetical protein